MKRTLASLFALSFAFASFAACEKKPPPLVVSSCVISNDAGKIVQCFEYEDEQAKKEMRAKECSQFEGASKKHADGPCPTVGSGGACLSSLGSKSICYDPADQCKTQCSKSGNTYTPPG